MEKSSGWIVFDGRIIRANEPVIPVVSRGLMYGDGAFETLRTYMGKTLFFHEHLNRLATGLDILGISYPPEIEAENLKPLIVKLLEKEDLLEKNAIVRLQVWRSGGRGYLPDTNAAPHFSITVSECPRSFKFPTLATVEIKRIPSESLPSNYKFNNGINYILAAKEAAKKGADDALMQTIDGYISESTIGNIFWLKDDTFFTPSLDCDLIPGITRKTVIDIIQEHEEWRVEEGGYGLNDILGADAVFMSNSVRELLPVKKIDNHDFEVENEMIHKLKRRFTTFRNDNLKPLE